MKNFEKYEKEIKTIANNNDHFGMRNGELVSCLKMLCIDCAWNGDEGCIRNKYKWLYEDYKEPALTEEENIQKQVDNISNYCKNQECNENCPYFSEGDDYDYLPSCRINNPRDWWYIKDEPKKQLLTEEEREYLSNVIKPFSSIICIDLSKTECTIHYTKDRKHSWFSIPNIFKNMQNVNGTREYSLKELGL